MPGLRRPRATRLSSVALDRLAGPGQDALVDVLHHQRDLEVGQEQRAQLRPHEAAADDRDLADAPRRDLGLPRLLAHPLLGQVEAVDRGLRLARRQQLGERVDLAPAALVEVAAAGGELDEVDREVRRARRPVRAAVGGGAGGAERLVESSLAGGVLLLVVDDALVADDPSSRKATEASKKSTLGSRRSARPSSNACLGRSTLLLSSALWTISCSAFGPPISRGVSCVPPHAREDREEDLGERDRGGGVGQRAVVAVQRDLQAAAHAGAVDGGDAWGTAARCRRRKAAWPASPPWRASVGVGALERVEVRAHREDEGLAGEQQALDVALALQRRSARRPASAARPRRRCWAWCGRAPLSIVSSASRPARLDSW